MLGISFTAWNYIVRELLLNMDVNVTLSSEEVFSDIIENVKRVNRIPKKCDVTIQCNNGQVYCTKLLLAAWSTFWREVLADNDNDAVIFFPESNVSTMRKMIKCLSTGINKMSYQDYIEVRDTLNSFMPDIQKFDVITNDNYDVEVDRALKKLPRKGSNKNISDCLKCSIHCPIRPKRGQESMKAFNEFEFDDKDEDKDYTCKVCLQFFSRKEARDNHMKNVHLKLQSYFCKLCEKQFASKNGLDAHMKSHNDTEKHKCPECEKVYKNSSTLFQHCRAKGHQFPEREEPKEIHPFDTKCNICHKYVGRMDHHMRVHHSEASRKFKCPECSFTTDRQDSLYKHTRLVHRLVRKKLDAVSKNLETKDTYGCSDCGKEFEKKDDIIDHITLLKDCNEIKCEQCDKRFTLRYNLNRHIKEVHQRETFSCPYCAKAYTQKRNRDRHAKKCTQKNNQ